MNIRFHSFAGAVAEAYEVPLPAAERAVEAMARQMGYPQPTTTGIWPRDAYSLLCLVERRIDALLPTTRGIT
jgi:hypothetical protein